MAKSSKIIFSGKGYWARVYEGNHDEYGGKEFYKITVALDGPSWAKFAQSGLSLKSKAVSSDSSDLGVTFKRDLEAKTGVTDKGEKWSLGGGAPRVTDADGEAFDKLIGNGSDVEVLVDIYEIQKGPMKGKKGHRLEAVRVNKLIPYDSPSSEPAMPAEALPF